MVDFCEVESEENKFEENKFLKGRESIFEERSLQKVCTKDTQRPNLRGGSNEVQLQLWSINVGGLPGLWRLIDHLLTRKFLQRPDAICIQEVTCGLEEFKATINKIDCLGYQIYANEGITQGKKTRGCMTLVKHTVSSKLQGEIQDQCGTMVAVQFAGVLLCNCYTPPQEHKNADFSAKLATWQEMKHWEGEQIWCGDFNEEFSDSWISVAASAFGLGQVSFSGDSTRWKGRRIIDYFLTNPWKQDTTAVSLEEVFSDHKVIVTTVRLGNCTFDDRTFKKQHSLLKPAWIVKKRWIELIEEACNHGILNEWAPAYNLFEDSQQTPEDLSQVDLDQHMIDYTWKLCITKVLWVHQCAFFLALLEIPAEFDNWKEEARVRHLANKIQTGRCNVEQSKRHFPVDQTRTPQGIRKAKNQLGRALELQKEMTNNRIGKKTFNLTKKLYGEDAEVTFERLQETILTLESNIQKFESDTKQDAYKSWRNRMSDPTQKSAWLKKNKISHHPNVEHEGKISTNKLEATTCLFESWESLHKQNEMTETERQTLISDLTPFYERKFKNVKGSGPTKAIFQKILQKSKGGAGLDQWSSHELRNLSAVPVLVEMIWNCMQGWTEWQKTPSILKEVKMVFIPKVGRICKGNAGAKTLRPITVYSCWWRAWSSTWIRSDWIKNMVDQMPTQMAGAKGRGPESTAAAIHNILKRRKHGASLDFTQCFDTVDLQIMRRTLTSSLKGEIKNWCATLHNHWLQTKRWFIYNKFAHPQPYVARQGLPQGDPASPLFLALLLWKGYEDIQQKFGCDLVQFIYLDDRTLLDNSKETVEAAIQEWDRFSSEFHLINNDSKTQRVDLTRKTGPKTMEVLGCLVGETKVNDFKNSKQYKRNVTAKHLAKRIYCLPEGLTGKMKGMAIYVKPSVDYGWVQSNPPDSWINSQNTITWNALGRLRWTPEEMRKIFGITINAPATLLLRRLRMKCYRDEILNKVGEMHEDELDLLIKDHMELYGWFKTDTTWHHSELPYQFEQHAVIGKKRGQVDHFIRQSQRKTAYDHLAHSHRHEFQDQIPAFDVKRIDMVRKLAYSKPHFLPFFIGAVKSPKMRTLRTNKRMVCPCGALNPDWEHIWQCAVGIVPSDVLLRRFLWPRTTDDLEAINSFTQAMNHFST